MGRALNRQQPPTAAAVGLLEARVRFFRCLSVKASRRCKDGGQRDVTTWAWDALGEIGAGWAIGVRLCVGGGDARYRCSVMGNDANNAAIEDGCLLTRATG